MSLSVDAPCTVLTQLAEGGIEQAGAALALGCVIGKYLVSRGRNVAPGTIRTYRECLGLFADDVGWDKPIGRITRRDVEAWVSHQHVAPATMRLRLSTLHVFFEWAELNGMIKRDPTFGVTRPKLPRRVPRAFGSSDVAKLLSACADDRERLMALLMVQECLRAVEVARAQLGDIDEGERLILVHGKGGHERIVPVSDETWNVLLTYLGKNPGEMPACPLVRSQVSPWDPISAKRVSRIVGDALRRAGLGGKAHRLRHTGASDMLDSGANIRDVQTALGHASLATTQIYLRAKSGKDLRGVMGGRAYRSTA